MTSDQIRIMVRDLADSAMLGGAVALSTSGTRATSGLRLCKSNNKLSGGIQRQMAYEATVAYILCIFHCIQMHMREQMELFAVAIEQEMSSLLGLIVRPEVRCCFR